MVIEFQRASGSTGTSHYIDIGSSGNNRLIIAVLGYEGKPGQEFQGTVSVNGKSFSQGIVAENVNGLGNHLELHTIDESILGSINGNNTVSYSSGNSNWAIHVLVFYGVNSNNIISSGIDNTTLGSNVAVNNINSNNNSLIVFAASNGGNNFADNWTSPLVERTDGPNPSSAVLAVASGIESTGQTNKSYSVYIGDGTTRSTGIIAVFDEKIIQTHQLML